ncbi:hypothetical protein WR25_13512 [Diploscapter pachys]|uniref:SAM domain-containing protein n=1 Tax=Diploscapter pachys TaxID=2018661 RepID=A0A2A2JVV9_9BILA|nr:hypothetical protein WR25_13512 [Diploscapter pachys]
MVIQYRLKDDEGRVKGEARERREGNDCDAWGGASVPSQCEAIVATGPVKEWMIAEGFSDYVDLFVNKHRIDGPALLMLSEFDLRDSMKIDCIGDVKRILLAIERLKLSLKVRIIRHVESPDTELKSFLKMVIACGYCLLALLVTAFVMVVVHDRVPDMKTYPPLPDLVLDNLPLIPWAFEMCEVIGLILFSLWAIILVFHKYRIILLRRMFSLVGTVFLLRCITMLITSLSVPGVHLECRSKSYGSLKDKLAQAFVIWSHGGMSIQGVRTCGDYMFSGHTTVVTLLNHFITESFYISSRMFLYYHAHAYTLNVHMNSDSRLRLWFPLGWFFESGSIGRVPNEFGMPISIYLPRRIWPFKNRNNGIETKSNESSNGNLEEIKQNGGKHKKADRNRNANNKPKMQ